MSHLLEDLVMFEGFEIPKKTKRKTKKILAVLRQRGIIIFEHDDGPDRIIRDELENIAGDIGLYATPQPYALTLMTEEFYYSNLIVRGISAPGDPKQRKKKNG